MDELFLTPARPIAMPKAYWLERDFDTAEEDFNNTEKDFRSDGKDDRDKDVGHEGRIMSSRLMLFEPDGFDHRYYGKDRKKFRRRKNEDDPAIIDVLYLDGKADLPHRGYFLRTAEFRRQNHQPYLGKDGGKWDPEKALEEAKYMHLSNSEQWLLSSEKRSVVDLVGDKVKCEHNRDGEKDCSDHDTWLKLYEDHQRRKEVRIRPNQNKDNDELVLTLVG
jgi:hypothetical protein